MQQTRDTSSNIVATRFRLQSATSRHDFSLEGYLYVNLQKWLFSALTSKHRTRT